MTVAEKLSRAKQDLDDVFEAGKAQGGGGYDWENIQLGGTRVDYRYMFGGYSWNDDNFKPIYDIDMRYGEYAFTYSKITNLKAILEKQNVKFDLSRNNNNVVRMFAFATITHIPDSMLNGVNDLNYFLANAKNLIDAGTITLKDTGTQTFNSCFQNCESLEEIRLNGVVGQDFDIHWSKLLTAESLNSIMTHLSTISTGKTLTLPAYATVKATYDDASAYGEGAWDAIVAEKSNWTIAYI